MRLILLLMLAGCSTSTSLKYKIHYQKRQLANQAEDLVRVARIEASFKSQRVFASGMDTTHLVVKLYDRKGQQLTSVDPADLTLSSSHEIEAQPFSLKQGVYKAVILPRPRPGLLHLQVEWKNKVKGPIVVLDATILPMKEKLSPLNHDYLESKSHGEIMVARGNRSPASTTEEFSLVNVGINKIVRNLNSSRTFHFEYPEQARQNIALQVDDAPNELTSQTLHSYFMLFPRKQLPVIEQSKEELVVTLPTGEKMIFNKNSKVIKTGVFQEGPLDQQQDLRHFPDLRYRGRGVVLRVNARGQTPQLSTLDPERIDADFGLRGSLDVLIINAATGERCRRPKSDFWDDHSLNPIEFKFATDELFDVYLRNHCGFGLPKF